MNTNFHLPRIYLHFVLITSLLAVLLIVGVFAARALSGPTIANVKILPVVSLEETQSQVSFAIPQPQWLPDGLFLNGSHAGPPNWAQYFYGRRDGGTGGLGIEITREATRSQYVFPQSAKQSAAVNGQSAFCVQGSWNENQEWISTANAGHLEWSANGFLYSIGYSGLGLTCSDLIRIAESLKQ